MPKGQLAGGRRGGRGGSGARGAGPDGGPSRTAIRSGEWKGYTGKAIPEHRQRPGSAARDPRARSWPTRRCATTTSRRDLTFRFSVQCGPPPTSSRRPGDLAADETLFIISSKTFGTLETLTNASFPPGTGWWTSSAARDAVARHFVAVLHQRRAGVGVRPSTTENMFGFLGLGSAAGTRWIPRSACPPWWQIGPENFAEMLAGFHEMDEHFRTAPFRESLPVLMAPARRVVRRTSFDAQTYGVMPYEQYLKRFPRLPAAADHGVERQSGSPWTAPRSITRRARVFWGGARDQRAAQLLPADPSGHQS